MIGSLCSETQIEHFIAFPILFTKNLTTTTFGPSLKGF